MVCVNFEILACEGNVKKVLIFKGDPCLRFVMDYNKNMARAYNL